MQHADMAAKDAYCSFCRKSHRDVGPLAESWRIEPGTPGYVTRLNSEELTAALAAAQRGR